jgi:two-component system chemotaxis response regulator CheB
MVCMGMDSNFDLIVLAASAGGLEAIEAILAELPADWTVPIAIVLHRTNQVPNLLSQVLGRRTMLRVKPAEVGETPAAGVIYLAPPDMHLTLSSDGTFTCHHGALIHHLHSSADPLLRSAAEVFGRRVIAVVLSGGGSDALDGVRAVHDAGGVVVAQDRATSRVFGMPGAAISSGVVNYTLPVERIGPALRALVRHGQLPRSSGIHPDPDAPAQ